MARKRNARSNRALPAAQTHRDGSTYRDERRLADNENYVPLEGAPDPAASWYLVRTGPRQERGARDAMVDAGFRTLLPELERPRPYRRRVVQSVTAMFPGYVLVQLEGYAHPAWQILLGDYYRQKGIMGVMQARSGGEPLRLPKRWMAELIECLTVPPEERRAAKRFALRRKLDAMVGGQYRIVDGPFATFSAIVTEARSPDDIRGEVAIFGRPTRINLHVDQLETT
ncbi:transcription termination/antitermination protein NusG [Chelatococcus reniformis]|uniref:Transcription termination/antitermination protein NusG n=1 Tax=Chelatococcus reniformis TaxID=1494448 RepID=A0A916UFR7_9HYPH|nr:transcription termination/antitermination NusG family protein [Chelatococcus reniformis]GGC70621.1 transcription termination/antitermination protein NusG [Chelatococcus reniformis]